MTEQVTYDEILEGFYSDYWVGKPLKKVSHEHMLNEFRKNGHNIVTYDMITQYQLNGRI